VDGAISAPPDWDAVAIGADSVAAPDRGIAELVSSEANAKTRTAAALARCLESHRRVREFGDAAKSFFVIEPP
jgi:hypothetical protein